MNGPPILYMVSNTLGVVTVFSCQPSVLGWEAENEARRVGNCTVCAERGQMCSREVIKGKGFIPIELDHTLSIKGTSTSTGDAVPNIA